MELQNENDDIGDTSKLRKSTCGLDIMESDSDKGIYIGPKDGIDKCDVFAFCDATHLTIKLIQYEKTFEISKYMCLKITKKGEEILKNLEKYETVNIIFKKDPTSILKITTEDIQKEMLDIRIWFKNCVGRWIPTRKGVRIHYIHFKNILHIINEMY